VSSAPEAPPSESSTAKPAKATGAVPVALTVLATVLAGLSSSEMTQSMFHRSHAAQYQAKAGAQWGFFQAKRIRGTNLETSFDLLKAVANPPPLDVDRLRAAGDRVEDGLRRAAEAVKKEGDAARDAADAVSKAADQGRAIKARWDAFFADPGSTAALRSLVGERLPTIEEDHTGDPDIKQAVAAIKSRQTEQQTASLVARVKPAELEEALESAEANADAFDQACQPITQAAKRAEPMLAELTAVVRRLQGPMRDRASARPIVDDLKNDLEELNGGLRAARQDFTARRYAKEAGYNQESAELYEVLVRRSGVDSDRHRVRSKNFFYAMLAAQAGVTIASLALAKAHRSALWLLAGLAGVTALGFGVFVYLAM
jgi:chemotaxis regulatin CheY-phosphate phosphatase CheZ